MIFDYIENKDKDRFLSTLPRSGSHYLVAILSAWDHLEQGLYANYNYVTDVDNPGDGRWAFSVEQGVPSDYNELLNSVKDGWYTKLARTALVCSHYPTFRPISYFDYTRMKTVVLVRDIEATSKSFYKYRLGLIINEIPRFTEHALPKLISFYNYWGHYEEFFSTTNVENNLTEF